MSIITAAGRKESLLQCSTRFVDMQSHNTARCDSGLGQQCGSTSVCATAPECAAINAR